MMRASNERLASGNAGTKSAEGSPLGNSRMFSDNVLVAGSQRCGKVSMLIGALGIVIGDSPLWDRQQAGFGGKQDGLPVELFVEIGFEGLTLLDEPGYRH